MTCSRCQKRFNEEEARCPFCGEPNPASTGVFQTSAVFISAGGTDSVYRSVEEVPARLRTKLLKCTNGSNSATILIADRKGRKEIARAMRDLPGPAQRRLRNTILGNQGAAEAPSWLTPARKRAILATLMLLVLLLVAFLFTHRWDGPFR